MKKSMKIFLKMKYVIIFTYIKIRHKYYFFYQKEYKRMRF